MTHQPADPSRNADEKPLPSSWNPFRWPRAVFIPAVAAVVALIPFALRSLMLAGVPPMAEPFDVEEFVKWDVPAEEDAFTDYRHAAKLRGQIDPEIIRIPANFDELCQSYAGEQDWDAAGEALKPWMEAQHEALTAWRTGTEKERGRSQIQSFDEMESILQMCSEQRMFVRLAMLEESRCIHQEQWDEAWRWTRAAYRCGGHTSNRGCVVQGLAAIAIHAASIGGMARWAENKAVTSQQLKAALAEVKLDHALYENPSNMLKAEYLAMRSTFDSTRWFMGEEDSTDLAARAFELANWAQFWVRGEPELTIRVSRQVLANQISQIDKPVFSRRAQVGSGTALLFDRDPTIPPVKGQLDPIGIDRIINRSLFGPLSAGAVIQFESATRRQAVKQAAIEALLAAQAYRRDHGDFPETLAVLVPDYLETVPLDPCAPIEAPLQYRRDDGAKAVIWSVGMNGTDEGGVIDLPNGTPPDVGLIVK